MEDDFITFLRLKIKVELIISGQYFVCLFRRIFNFCVQFVLSRMYPGLLGTSRFCCIRIPKSFIR